MNGQVNNQRQPEPDFHGAAIIDEQGREIPITEAMVQRACRQLQDAWCFPVTGRSPRQGN